MSKFNPEKLTVTYIPPVTESHPADGRKYTLTHSDLSGDLFLSIGPHYDYAKINQKMRDEVLGEWHTHLGQYYLSIKIYISGGEYDENISKVRYLIFQKDLELALQAMMYGDRKFFRHFPWLLDSPIAVCFESVHPNFSHTAYYGTPRRYLDRKRLAELGELNV
ncbi:staygreen family protein [Peribacillus sp. SCS-155]|uniref:staygreen family protein n=1 Tax=Peribacillus sedimenti TaxID=3115297 RepID=UPI003905F301